MDTKQVADLNLLNKRISEGYKPTATDTANLDYAKTKGYSFNPLPEGATKISGPSGLQGLNESQLYRMGADIYKLPDISDTVDLTTNVPSVPVVPTPESRTESYMAGVDTTLKGLENTLLQINTPSEAEKQISPIRERVQTETDKFEQKPADFEEQLDKYGFQPNVEELQKILPQIEEVKAQYDKLAEQNRNLPISSRIIGGTQDRLLRQQAIELQGLSAVAQALQGNVNMAVDIAETMTDMKYEPIQMQIDNQKWQLDQVYDQLSREDKRKADSLNLVIAERERMIAEEKEKETNIANIMASVAQAGGDTATLQRIMEAESYAEAIKISAPFLNIQEEGTAPQKIGTDENGNDLYYNPITKTVQTGNQLVADELGANGITSPSGNNYDMSTYATDPKHADSVQNKINEIGKFNSIQDIDAYIQSKYPNSQITGRMIAEASAQYGIGWEELVALMDHESYLGTSNVAKSNNNPGGITWNANFPESMKGTSRPGSEGGNYVKFDTMQDGVNSVAFELGRRKVDIKDTPEDNISDYEVAQAFVNDPDNKDKSKSQLKSDLMEGVNTGQIKLSVSEINAILATVVEQKEKEKEENKPETFSEEWFKSKINTARDNDFSDAEIVNYIFDNYDANELFKTAKDAGYAKWYSGKEADIKRYIKSLL